MKRTKEALQKLTKDQLIDMFAKPETHVVNVELTFCPNEPDIMYWYWDGGMSGWDDMEDFLKNVFPRFVKDEIETTSYLFHEEGEEEIPF